MGREKITSSDDKEIRTTMVDFSFGELLNLHKSKEIVIRPEYQRLFRWSIEQRSRLIESILIGLPIPPIFFIEDDQGVLELIDGLQRTSSVLQFIDHTSIGENELTLVGCDILKDLNGVTFEHMAVTQKLKIKRSPIRATIINKSGDPYIKYEMFKRLNTGGSLLSSQEIRNCSSRMIDGGDEFYEVIKELALNEEFKKTISRLPETYVEKRGDEELVLRFFALTLYRSGYKGNIEEWLDDFMEKVLFKKIKFNFNEQKDIFYRVFKTIHDKAEDEAFTRFNDRGGATGRLAPAYFEAVTAAVADNIEVVSRITPESFIKKIKAAFSDNKFKSATGPGANTIEKLHKRIEIVTSFLV